MRPVKVKCQFLVSIAVLLGCSAGARAEDRSIELFDGKTFTGWTDFSGGSVPNNWKIEDGLLVLGGRGGSLFTKDEYGDFDLTFEWKISARGNGGVKYRMAFYEKGVFGQPGWLGCEYQMLDDPNGSLSKRNSSGALYDLYEPVAERDVHPAGEFNTSRIRAQGKHIQHWLNGTLTVDAEIGSDEWRQRLAKSKFAKVKAFAENPKGRIQLQDHNSQVWFRKIVLTEIGGS